MGYTTTDRNSFLDTTITSGLYLALFTVAPNDEGVGGTEVSGGSYARVAIPTLGSASAGSKTTTADVEFPESTASWGTEVAVAVMDAATAGNQVAVSDTFTSKTIASGEIARFSAGELTFTFT